MNRPQRRTTSPLLCSLLVLCAGCEGSSHADVQGRVTRHDGTPLAGATVTARSDETGQWARGVTDADGQFQLGGATAGDGIAAGEYYVTVAEDRGDMGQLPATIPARYERPTQSRLTLTVVEGESKELNLTLDPM